LPAASEHRVVQSNFPGKLYMDANAEPGPRAGGDIAKAVYCYIFSDSIC